MRRLGFFLEVIAFVILVGCTSPSARVSPYYVGLSVHGAPDVPPSTPHDSKALISIHDPARARRAAIRAAYREESSDCESCRRKRRPQAFYDLALRTSGCRMGSTEQKLDRRLDVPLKLDVFDVFDDPTTPVDRRTSLALNTLAFGVGRIESETFAWNVYGGFAAGCDRNHQKFMMTELDVNFSYGAYFAGISAEYYPWSVAEGFDDMTWNERFAHSRPFLVGGFEFGYVSAEADGKYSVFSTTLYRDGETVRDWVFSVPLGVGWSVPLDEDWSLQTVFDYRLHFYRPEEYNGWNLTTALRRRF